MMAKRTRYFITWFGFRWHLRVEGKATVKTFRTKEEAVDWARFVLDNAWRQSGYLSELNIRTRLGRIAEKETYGKDPGRRKG